MATPLSSEAVELFDAHCHLQDARLDGLVSAALASCSSPSIAGHRITRWAVNGTCEADWPSVLSLAASHQGVTPSLGLHPWRVAAASPDWLESLTSLLAAYPGACVGEAGLDGALVRRGGPSLSAQAAALGPQLKLARALGRPVSLHCVSAGPTLMDCLRSTTGPYDAGIILHSFAGAASDAAMAELVSLGAYFSLSGSLARLAPPQQGLLVGAIPPERLLIETDCPDGLPPKAALAAASAAGRPFFGASPEGPRALCGWDGDSGGDSITDSVTDSPMQFGCHGSPRPACHPASLGAVLALVATAAGKTEAEVGRATAANAARVFRA